MYGRRAPMKIPYARRFGFGDNAQPANVVALKSIMPGVKKIQVDPQLWKQYKTTAKSKWPAEAKQSYNAWLMIWEDNLKQKPIINYKDWDKDSKASWEAHYQAHGFFGANYFYPFLSRGIPQALWPTYATLQFNYGISTLQKKENRFSSGIKNVKGALSALGTALVAPVKNSLQIKNILNPVKGVKSSLSDAGRILSTADKVIQSTNVIGHGLEKANWRAIRKGHFTGKVLGRAGNYALTKPIETVGIVWGATSIANVLTSSAASTESASSSAVEEMTPPVDAPVTPPAPTTPPTDWVQLLKEGAGYISTGSGLYNTVKGFTSKQKTASPATLAPTTKPAQTPAQQQGGGLGILAILGLAASIL